MASSVQSIGDIEAFCESTSLKAGETASIFFRVWDDVEPPLTVKVKDPSGKTIFDRVIRALPTGEPQSAPPISFSLPQVGVYKISIRQLYGKLDGEAKLTIT